MYVYYLKKGISAFVPKTSIAVDTNVLLWYFYKEIDNIKKYQEENYPIFLSEIVKNKKNKIYTTIFNILELYNIIEDNEYKKYIKLNKLSKESFSKKDYRKNLTEREKIKNRLNLVFKKIKNDIGILTYDIKQEFLDDYILNFLKHKYDIFDFSLIKCCIENNISFILTDDSDFSSKSYLLDNFSIITANKNLN